MIKKYIELIYLKTSVILDLGDHSTTLIIWSRLTAVHILPINQMDVMDY